MKSITSIALMAAGMALTSACASANGQETVKAVDDSSHKTMIVKRSGNRHVVSASGAAEDIMEDKDLDGDGRISTKEYYTGSNQGRFDEIDTDEDGYIDNEELEKTLEDRISRAFDGLKGHKWVQTRRLGENGDFEINFEGMDAEIQAQVREAHEKAAEAMAKVELKMSGLRERMEDNEFFFVAPHIEGFHMDEEEMAAMKDKHRARLLKKLDKNGDGGVSREEFAARTNKKFDKLDKDEDGKLSGDELDRHFAFGNFSMPHLAGNAAKWEFRFEDDSDDHSDDDEEDNDKK